MRSRKPDEPVTPEAARAKALRLLGRREHSARELATKLRVRGVDASEARELVDGLSADGWQDDRRYAEVLLNSRIARGYGPLHIRAELSAKGVAASTIEAALDEFSPDWQALARELWERKFGAAPETRDEALKQHRYLSSRGFEYAQIKPLLRGDLDSDEL